MDLGCALPVRKLAIRLDEVDQNSDFPLWVSHKRAGSLQHIAGVLPLLACQRAPADVMKCACGAYGQRCRPRGQPHP